MPLGISLYGAGGRASWYNEASTALNRVLPSLVHDYVSNRYYNTADGETSFPFTATRTSNATMFDAQGRLVWAPANLNGFSSASTATDGIIGSGGVVPTGWATGSAPTGITRSVQKGVDASGNSYLDYRLYGTNTSGSAGYPNLYPNPNISVSANEPYTSSVYAYVVAGSTVGFSSDMVRLYNERNLSGSYVSNSSAGSTLSSTPSRLVLNDVIPSSGVNQIRPELVFAIPNGATVDVTVRVWNPQVERTGPDSPKDFNATSGSVYYGPRLDYNPNGNTAMGLLVEEARTNVCPDYLTVTMTNGSVATGTNFFGTASKQITWDGTFSLHIAAYTVTTSAPAGSTLYTVSAYVRKVSGSGLIQLSGSSNFIADTANDYANFDLNTGTVVNGSSITDSSIVSFGNNIYRISMTFTTKASPTAGASVALFGITSTSDTRGTANTLSDVFECFGGQLESGRGVSSLIPTYGAAATRNADTFSTTSVSWLSQSVGTWYVAFTPKNAISSSRRVISVSDGSANNSYGLIRSTSRVEQIRTAIASVSDFTPSTANSSTDFALSKSAMLLNSPTKKAVLNGGTVASASVAFPTSGYTTFSVGPESGAATHHGWVKEIRYYASASASDAQLQTLTT